jgi:hypothetical protein
MAVQQISNAKPGERLVPEPVMSVVKWILLTVKAFIRRGARINVI